MQPLFTSAMVVLSGGQDSTTCLLWAKAKFKELHAVTFDYGQRHHLEIEAAKTVARIIGVDSHEVVVVGPILKGKSPLTDPNAALEKYEDFEQMDKVIGDRRELTFVPMRNPLFFVIAVNRAECLGVRDLVTGVCEADNANYSDCRESFLVAMDKMTNEALGYMDDFTIRAPLLHKRKDQSVMMAYDMGPESFATLAFTHTSYDGLYPPTDMNHANVLRAEGFKQASLPDPLVVRAWSEGLMPLPTTENYADEPVVQQISNDIRELRLKHKL